MTQGRTPCCLLDLGLVEYDQAYLLQKECVHGLLGGGLPSLLLCEHPKVLTCGRLTDQRNRLVSEEELIKKRVQVRCVNRGGDMTIHAPGQLVIYPIFNLTCLGKDLRRYLYQLEQVAIDLLGGFDIVANRFPGQTGVWVKEKKIASIGIGVRKWISFHGLAINVNTDLRLFSMIRPCGLNVEMTSMSELKKKTVSMGDVKKKTISYFSEIFGLDFLRSENE